MTESPRRIPPAPPDCLPAVVRKLGWVSLFTDVATEMAYPLLPAFLLSIGAGLATLGVMEGVAESVSALVKWLTGRASDGRARKPFVVVGYAVATVARPVLVVATRGWHVVDSGDGPHRQRAPLRATGRAPGERGGAGAARIRVRVPPNDGQCRSRGRPARRVHAGARRWSVGPHRARPHDRPRSDRARDRGGCARDAARTVVERGCRRDGSRSSGRSRERNRGNPAERDAPVAGTLARVPALVGLFTLGASADSFLILRLMDWPERGSCAPRVDIAQRIEGALEHPRR